VEKMKKRFIRSESYRKKLGEKWRRPKGRHNKMRLKLKSKRKMPSIGYRTKKSIRGLHPSGYEEILIETPSQFDNVNKERQAIRISATVGRRKKELIIKKAEELGIKILNR